jgi:hypothetical protein
MFKISVSGAKVNLVYTKSSVPLHGDTININGVNYSVTEVMLENKFEHDRELVSIVVEEMGKTVLKPSGKIK